MNQIVLRRDRTPPALRRPAPRRADLAFLPAAIEIIETPASPAATAFLLLICAFCVGAIGWASMGRIDIFAEASGTVQPVGQSKTVEALDPGRVQAVEVAEGSRVKAGDVLVRLDPAEATAELDGVVADLAARRAEVLRRGAAMEAVAAGSAPAIDWPADIPPAIRAREERVLGSDLATLEATLATLRAAAEQKTAERSRLVATIAAESELIATLQERVTMRSTLVELNAGTKAGLLDATQQVQAERASLVASQGWLGEAEAAIRASAVEQGKTRQQFLADNAQKLAETARQVDDLGHRLAKARALLDHRTLLSPIDGIVQSLAITTVGQVVTVGQQVMRIVPEDAPLEIKAYVENRDIGFLRQGQAATVKVEAFPFTRYGTLTGTVVRIARDAVPTPDTAQMGSADRRTEASRNPSGAQIRNLVYPVIVRLDRAEIEADGQRVTLGPGMAVSVEIQTGSRRLIDYVVAPLTEIRSRAMHER